MRARAFALPELLAFAIVPCVLFLSGCTSVDPMRVAAARGRVDTAQLYLEANPDLSVERRKEYLVMAAAWGHKEFVRFWIQSGANSQEQINSALCWAAGYGRLETTRMLLDLGADPNADAGVILVETPIDLMFSVASGTRSPLDERYVGEPQDFLGTLKLIYAAGANPRFQGAVSRQDLDAAKARGHGDLVAMLKAMERDWASRKKEPSTP